MKISKSKQELARIISENGGWKNSKAEWAAQDGSNGQVSFFKNEKPTYSKTEKEWMAFGDSVHCYDSRIEGCEVIKNFHQTILSRAEYRNAKDYADRKQQEADAAKAKLKALKVAGEALGLLVSPITAKQEPELVITDWRDLQVEDEVECVDYELKYRFGVVSYIDSLGGKQCVEVSHPNGEKSWPTNWRFIRRP